MNIQSEIKKITIRNKITLEIILKRKQYVIENHKSNVF